MLLEIMEIDLNRINMISDVRAVFLLFPSLPPVLHAEEQTVWLQSVLTSSCLLAGQELQLLYAHSLNKHIHRM